MSVDDVAPTLSGAWDGVDLAGLPLRLADALRRFMADTDLLCATGDPGELDGRQAEVTAAVLSMGVSRLTVTRTRLLPVIEADGLWALTGAQSFPVWLSHAHGVGISTARTQVRLARRLRDHLPVTAAAAAAGEISVEQATLIATLGPTTDQRREVLADPATGCDEAFLVQQAALMSPDETRALMRQWAAYADPDADDRGYVEAADREYLDLHRLGDGYHLTGQLTVEHGQALKAALAAVTPVPAAGDTRSTGQRRAQALADLARLTLEQGVAGAGKAAVPRVSVLVDYPTFTALVDPVAGETAGDACAGGRSGTGTGAVEAPQAESAGSWPRWRSTRRPTPPIVTPDMLTGKTISGGPQFEDRTPIPRLVLARLACDSEVKRFVFGSESEILDVGRSRRTFPRGQRAAIIARDKHCRYPGCRAPAAISECHHVRQWVRDHGGTSVDNGVLLCWHHHDLVHRLNVAIARQGSRWMFTDARGREIAADDVPPDPPPR